MCASLCGCDVLDVCRYYSGVAKVGPMMQWVSANSGIALDLPHMPQFTDEERELFKEQITARQQHLAARKAADASAGGGSDTNSDSPTQPAQTEKPKRKKRRKKGSKRRKKRKRPSQHEL